LGKRSGKGGREAFEWTATDTLRTVTGVRGGNQTLQAHPSSKKRLQVHGGRG